LNAAARAASWEARACSTPYVAPPARQALPQPDLTLGLAIRYSQGVMLGSEAFRARHAAGLRALWLVAIVAWADPQRGCRPRLDERKTLIANQLPALYGVLRAIAGGVPRG
jgi:hypothetical protein